MFPSHTLNCPAYDLVILRMLNKWSFTVYGLLNLAFSSLALTYDLRSHKAALCPVVLAFSHRAVSHLCGFVYVGVRNTCSFSAQDTKGMLWWLQVSSSTALSSMVVWRACRRQGQSSKCVWPCASPHCTLLICPGQTFWEMLGHSDAAVSIFMCVWGGYWNSFRRTDIGVHIPSWRKA